MSVHSPGKFAAVRAAACLLGAMFAAAMPCAAHADRLADPAPNAADAPAPIRELWINPGFYAYHFQRDRHLNNRASGLGAEYRFSPSGAITVGVYHNSNWSFSHYLGYYWRPLAAGPARLGLIAGAVDGYPGTRKGGWFPAVLPTLSVEYRRVGLNMFYIPSYRDSVNGSITFQVKLRLF